MFLRNVLLAIGVLALLAGATIATLWLMQPPSIRLGESASTQTRQSILVAAQPIAAGTLLRREDMRWKDMAGGEIAPTYLIRTQVSYSNYVGAVARRAFAAGDPLTASALVKSNERDFLAAMLGPGMRAVSIAVDAPQSTAGMIQPGDRVDAILTQKFSDTVPAARRAVGEIILRDLRIVAVDQWTNPTTKPIVGQGTATADLRIPKTVTLEVSEADAKKLIVATEIGKLSFSLRALESGTPTLGETPSAPTWAADVSQAFGTNLSNSPTMRGASQTHTSVEVVRGSKTQAH